MNGTSSMDPPRRAQRRSGLGTGTTSLLMIFTLLCLATLALLSLTTAKGDARIKQRGLQSAQSTMSAQGAAQRELARIDEALADMPGGVYTSEAAYAANAILTLEALGYAPGEDLRLSFTTPVDENNILVTTLHILPNTGTGPRYELLGQSLQSIVEWQAQPEGGVWIPGGS